MLEIDERRAWQNARILLLIGPGGAGKSTLGSELAPLLGRRLIDLDDEFHRRVGDISNFMASAGYERYKMQNSLLAADIAAEAVVPSLMVASSGFLTPDNPRTALKANLSLLAACYSVCLLPSRNLGHAVSVVVERQLARPFGRGRAGEEAAIRARYQVYAALGDLVVFSTASPSDIATAVARHTSTVA
jgi:shikimate kinase